MRCSKQLLRIGTGCTLLESGLERIIRLVENPAGSRYLTLALFKVTFPMCLSCPFHDNGDLKVIGSKYLL
jgi:hypothetical protein